MKTPSTWALLALAVALLGVLLAGAFAARARLIGMLPPQHKITLLAWRHGLRVDHDVRIAAAGATLAASVFTPRQREGALPTVLIRLPYDRLQYGEGFWSAIEFARHGYAVVVQDLRGTGASTGELMPWRDAGADGAATLDWITRQPWSNGRVGTLGCSALGETQFPLARLNHPAHRAMIPSGAGGGIGAVQGRYGYFGVFEGGVFQLASGFGWFVANGSKDPAAPPPRAFDTAAHLRTLPVSQLVERVRPSPNGYTEFLTTPLGDPRWHDWGYWGADDRSRVPAFFVNTWGDQTVEDTLALAEVWRTSGTPRKVVIAPGNHCEHDAAAGGVSRFGELEVANGGQPWATLYRRWFDHWLKDDRDALDDLPPYTYFMLRENRWLSSDRWPPAESARQRWYLASGGHANTRGGDGRLLPAPPVETAAFDEFRYDPNDPVPTRGGPVCCTGDPASRSGPSDQSDVESRPDVLVYTSAPLTADLRIAGPLRARLVVSSDALDTDLVVRLVDVGPDQKALGIQEGALRLRYRGGFDRPELLRPGVPVEVEVNLRSIAHRVPRGHRLRLHVTSSSFPRLERNLNTGAANNAEETRTVVATNRIHHMAPRLSWLELSALPAPP